MNHSKKKKKATNDAKTQLVTCFKIRHNKYSRLIIEDGQVTRHMNAINRLQVKETKAKKLQAGQEFQCPTRPDTLTCSHQIQTTYIVKIAQLQ